MKGKTLAAMTAAILLAALCVNGGENRNWDFSKDSQTLRFVGIKDKVQEASSLKFLTEKDSQVYLGGAAVNAADFGSIEVVMKSDKDATGQLFFAPTVKELSEKASVRFPVKASDSFVTYRIDLSGNELWTGSISCLRLDPVEKADVNVELKTVSLKAPFSWDFNAGTLLGGWTSTGASELTYTADSLSFVCGKDPILQSPALKVDASKYNAIEVVMASDKDDALQVFFGATSKDFSEKGSVRAPVKASADFQTYTLKLSSNALWTGTIGALRVDPVNKADTKIQIKSIKLVNL